MTLDEIIEMAERYVSEEEMVPVPREGELFCFLHRSLEDDSEWQFGGYGKILSYTPDMEEKPLGKWICVSYLSLNTFPPQEGELKLQPPHIAKGCFQSPDRTIETRILAIEQEEEKEDSDASLIPFKKK